MMSKFEKVRMCLEVKTKYFTLKKNIGGKYVIAYKNIPAITSLTFNTLDEIIKAYQLKIWGEQNVENINSLWFIFQCFSNDNSFSSSYKERGIWGMKNLSNIEGKAIGIVGLWAMVGIATLPILGPAVLTGTMANIVYGIGIMQTVNILALSNDKEDN